MNAVGDPPAKLARESPRSGADVIVMDHACAGIDASLSLQSIQPIDLGSQTAISGNFASSTSPRIWMPTNGMMPL